MGSTNHIVVSGPAHPETLSVLRSVAASVGARADLPYERIEELRIAVDEAATLALRAGDASELRLTLDLTDPGSLRVVLATDATITVWPDGQITSWNWIVLDQLAEGAMLSVDEQQHPAVRFAWALAEAR
jgi:histidine kinase-like protein